jgi:rod shape-determining protein MreC
MILSVFPGLRPTVVEQGLSLIIVPMQRGATATITWVQGRFGALADNSRLIAENAVLREENNRLILEIEQLHLAGEENYYLTNLMEMRQRFPELQTIGARVIAQNQNNWRSRFTIEIGSRDGIVVNMPVLYRDAVIGIIHHVGLRYAEVTTLFDSEFSVAVHSVRTETSGIVRGDIQLAREGLLRMDFIAATANIMPGDTLVTCVYSPLFPPGLPVGTVVSVHPNPDNLTQYALVEPAAGETRPQMVLVVRES